MLVKPKTSGPGKVVRFKRRQVRRNPRRPLEAVRQDFERWDVAAAAAGLNWSEFTRRALNAASGDPEQLEILAQRQRLSEKGAFGRATPARKKAAAKSAGRKG